jgi:hypothetical protein
MTELSPASQAIVIAAELTDELSALRAQLASARDLSQRWALGALRVQGSDPDGAAWMRMAAAELQDVLDGTHPLIAPPGHAEMIAMRRERGH